MKTLFVLLGCVLLATAICEAQEYEGGVPRVDIILVQKSSPSVYCICKVDENYFMVPRSLLTRRVTIRAANGVSIYFPWQASQCKSAVEWVDIKIKMP